MKPDPPIKDNRAMMLSTSFVQYRQGRRSGKVHWMRQASKRDILAVAEADAS